MKEKKNFQNEMSNNFETLCRRDAIHCKIFVSGSSKNSWCQKYYVFMLEYLLENMYHTYGKICD